MKSKIICIQAFVKPILLTSLIESLKNCIGIKDYTILIWFDSTNHMKYLNREDWVEKNKKCLEIAEKYKSQNFCKNFVIKQNEENLGTAKTCYTAITYAFSELGEYVIFTEDDTIFSKDALIYFNFFYQNNYFKNLELWSIVGESPFFDSKGQIFSKAQIEEIKKKTNPEELGKFYSKINWVNSTQFSLTKEVWNHYGEVRGRKMGAIEFGELCIAKGGHSIYPIIARVKDVGMEATDGYSFYHHGKNVSELKNTYISSDDLNFVNQEFEEYVKNKNQLFAMTSKIKESKGNENEFQLTPHMSNNELNFLLEESQNYDTVLEIGIGGSTKTFIEKGKKVFSFETDSNWINKIEGQFDSSSWTYFHINIGEIKFLGYPKNNDLLINFSHEVTNLYKALNKLNNPLIFNDGRFRVFVQAISFLTFPNSKLLFHDYSEERPHYDEIFKFSDVINKSESMYLFKRKENVSNEYLQEIIEKYKLDPR